jgi:hypothetical protein
VDYGGKGLGESAGGSERDGGLGDAGVTEKAGEERGGKEGQVYGEKEREVSGGVGEGGADTAEGTQAERVFNERGKGGKGGMAAGKSG